MTSTHPADLSTSVLSILNGRDKAINGYAYKLGVTPNQYGMDSSFINTPNIDEQRMCVDIPFADGQRRDGVGDLLEVGGINTSRHQSNPIILFDHGKKYEIPVALAEDPETLQYTVHIDTINKVATAKAFFYQGKGLNGLDQQQESQHALFCEQLFDLIAKRYIRAGSIGYQVVKAMQLSENYETGTPAGLHLLSVLMLEASAVVLPANGDTVRKALCLNGVCGKPMSPVLYKSLEPYATPLKTQMLIETKVMKAKTKDWTTVRGAHVELDEKGVVIKGPKALKGKTLKKRKVPLRNLPEGKTPPAKWKPGAGAMKKRSMADIRKKYRPMKSLRRRMKKSVTGSSICYIKSQDLVAAKNEAGAKGLDFHDLGSGKNMAGVHKVRLSGSDKAMDDFVKAYGVPIRAAKSLKTQGTPMQHKKKALMQEGIDEAPEPKTEPFGAQVLRRLHEDHSILMKDYDEMMDVLEEQKVKGHLRSKLEDIEKHMTETEKLFSSVYKDLPSIGMDQDMDGDIEGDEVFEEDGAGMEEEGNMDMDTMDDNGVRADSDLEELEPPEDAVEGMMRKSLNHRKATQAIRAKYQKGSKAMCSKCKKNDCKCGGKCMVDPWVGQPGPCPGTEQDKVNNVPNPQRRFRKDLTAEEAANLSANIDAQTVDTEANPKPLDDDLMDHQKAFANEAGDFLDELSKTTDYGDEHRMKSYHYHKLLDFQDNNVNVPVGGAVIGGNSGEKALPGEPGYEEEEAMEPEHQEPAPGVQAEADGVGATPELQQQEELNPPQLTKGMKRRNGCKDASKFFKELAKTHDFAEAHRIKCAVMAKTVKDLMTDDTPVQDVPEEEVAPDNSMDPNMVGEMGEKNYILSLKDIVAQQDKAIADINNKMSALLAL